MVLTLKLAIGRPVIVDPIEVLDINKRAIASARDYLEMAGISGQIDRIIASYHQVTPATNGLIDDLEFADITPYVPPPLRMDLHVAPMITVPLPKVPQPTILPQFKFLTLNII